MFISYLLGSFTQHLFFFCTVFSCEIVEHHSSQVSHFTAFNVLTRSKARLAAKGKTSLTNKASKYCDSRCSTLVLKAMKHNKAKTTSLQGKPTMPTPGENLTPPTASGATAEGGQDDSTAPVSVPVTFEQLSQILTSQNAHTAKQMAEQNQHITAQMKNQ